jgi:dTDP-4-dehydrorhamnose reductase
LKILLTGKNGQVGWELQRALSPLGSIAAFDKSELDVTNTDAVNARVRDVRPDIIVNAGAYTSVDGAEREPEWAMAVNGIAPGILAEAALRMRAFLIHYSTDYVFDGAKTSPYREEDVPNPINMYGATKLAGEIAIRQVGPAHIILRTSWVYGIRGRNFLLKILQLLQELDELRVVSDQVGAPTWCRAIADATARILEMRRAGTAGTAQRECNGLFHLTTLGSTSWYEFAREIVARVPPPRGRPPKMTPISSDDYLSPAKRPKNSILANDKFHATFGFTLNSWLSGLEGALADYDGRVP